MCLSGCGGDDPGCDDFRFDRQAWLSDRGRPDADTLTDQQRISDDLIRCRFLEGRTRRDVRHLLGPPLADSSKRTWRYITGMERSPIQTRPEVLRVHFGDDGRVRETERTGL